MQEYKLRNDFIVFVLASVGTLSALLAVLFFFATIVMIPERQISMQLYSGVLITAPLSAATFLAAFTRVIYKKMGSGPGARLARIFHVCPSSRPFEAQTS